MATDTKGDRGRASAEQPHFLAPIAREEVEVELTFDPPWTPDRMSGDAKFILGF